MPGTRSSKRKAIETDEPTRKAPRNNNVVSSQEEEEDWALTVAHSLYNTPPREVSFLLLAIGREDQNMKERFHAWCEELFVKEATLNAPTVAAYHCVWTLLQTESKTLHQQVSPKDLLFFDTQSTSYHEYMPQRYREYYVRWKQIKPSKKSSKLNSQRPFLIRVVDWVLQQQEEASDSETLGCALDFIRDVLSLPAYNSGVADYLESVHWTVQTSSSKKSGDFSNVVYQDILHFMARPISVYRNRARIVQQLCLKKEYPVPDLMYAGGGALQNPTFVKESISNMTDAQLHELLYTVCWKEEEESENMSRQDAVHLLLDYLIPPVQSTTTRRPHALYPTELDIRMEVKEEEERPRCQHPKLALGHFLTLSDYWDRHYRLVRASAAYECGMDVAPAVRRMHPRLSASTTGKTEFTGTAHNTVLQLQRPLEIVRVLYGAVKTVPTKVVAKFSLSPHNPIAKYETLLLISVNARNYDSNNPLASTQVRGCHVVHVPGEEQEENNAETTTKESYYTVHLDPVQYATDRDSNFSYDSIQAVVRREPKVNQFRSVLECIRTLGLASSSDGKAWWNPILLGEEKKTISTPTTTAFLDFADTFRDADHVRASFPDSTVVVEGGDDGDTGSNYRIRVAPDGAVKAVAYKASRQKEGATVRFTPRQVAAIQRGLQPCLSLVVGPPGTGKTDVAVQIIAALYHSFPTQRTVVVAHSNAALNDIFTKVMERGDIPERYMIRLGAGERELVQQTDHDFTQQGRVAYSLERRSVLLEQAQVLSESLGLSGRAERGADGSPSYTCETAEYFYRLQVVKKMQAFEKGVIGLESASNVRDIFPFTKYFDLADDVELACSQAQTHIADLKELFAELAEYRPLELLRTQRQRGDYLIMKQARVVAMTCTHAAISREHLLSVGFEYDNLVIEEAGQMLEIETVIPMFLQKEKVGSTSARLKRITILGDHNQLPPVIQHMTLARYSSFDQSLLARLIRIGTPYTMLDQQGRSRSDLADLYRYRYDSLQDMPHIGSYATANAGLAHVTQLIDVQDYEGQGEQCPRPHYYQNKGEAEYAVALFQYLVLIGHAPQTISLLTTYNGQKELLKNIIEQRCGPGTPLGGVEPGAVATVDQYQGQQNEIVILSLVRTLRVGHLQDVRRLVVAVSRARKGLYIFCRKELFAGCHTLKQTMDQLLKIPDKLELVIGENPPCKRNVGEPIPKDQQFEVEDVGHLGEMVHEMQKSLN